MPFDPTKLDSHVAEFRREEADYKELGQALERVLQTAKARIVPLAHVQCRVKTLASFAKKILTKEYINPKVQCTDVVGARVIVHSTGEVARFCNFIWSHFEVDKEHTQNTAERLAAKEFGYRSVHCVVQFKPNVFPLTEVPERVLGKKAEIQVRTVAEHVWADISHDRLYKTKMAITPSLEREAARMAAILESVDNVFAQLVEQLDDFRRKYDTYANRTEIEKELKELRTIFTYDADNEQLVRQIAKLLINLEDWEGVIRHVSSFQGERSAALHSALGFAICQLHEGNRHSKEYTEGRSLFEKALQLDPHHLEAALHLAGTGRDIDDEKTSLAHYHRAYTIDSNDPGALGGYLTRRIKRGHSLDVVSVLRPYLESAIARCTHQAELKINLPDALYWKGLFQMLLEQPYASLETYMRAIGLTEAGNSIDRALHSVDMVSHADSLPPEWEWVRRLLLLAKCSRFPQSTSGQHLQKLASKPLYRLEPPVVIVAGGTDPAYQDLMEGYRELVQGAFGKYQGTIISGGTTAGICGLVGELRQRYPDKLCLIGYIPAALPFGTKADEDRYELRPMEGESTFTPLQPLQNWIDLLASGIPPAQVKILGINGGAIAYLEYRLALALGATVAVVRESGREAGKLAREAGQEEIKGLVLLPPDPMTLQEFFREGKPSSMLVEHKESIAQRIHEDYLRKKHKETRDDPALKEWDKLLDDFKESCRQQADNIFEKLAAVGLKAVQVDGRKPKSWKFSEAEIEKLAEMEHARYNVERFQRGWTWGPVKDSEKKQNPALVGWAELPPEEKMKDLEAVKAIPALLAKIGLEIQKA